MLNWNLVILFKMTGEINNQGVRTGATVIYMRQDI